MHETFMSDVRRSGYIHRPLPLYDEHSLEREQRQHAVIESVILLGSHTDTSDWSHRGVGELQLSAAAQGQTGFSVPNKIMESGSVPSDDLDAPLLLHSPTSMAAWPEGAPEDGDYTNFGNAWMVLKLPRADWTGYNRITLELRPDFPGVPNAYVRIKFRNEGAIPVPDLYDREGYHGMNLRSGEWNSVQLNMEELPRDAVTEIAIGYMLNGKDRATGDEMALRVRSIKLERAAEKLVSKGWTPAEREIIYSHSGYLPHGAKIAFASADAWTAASFQLIRCDDEAAVFTAEVRPAGTALGQYALLDFSSFTQEGRYYLRAEEAATGSFEIGDAAQVWQPSVWKALNFIFGERCGYPVPGVHGSCHADIVAKHNGLLLSYNGGWHDAGDVSQQTIQSAEVTMALFEMAEQARRHDEDLYWRLLEEGEWGLDFLLKTRFGDGYRATSAGMTRWTDGRIGGMDDAAARVHNQAYENFYCAGIAAYIHLRLPNAALAARLLQAAQEDFQYALDEFAMHGFNQKPIMWEHTYMTSESLYMATASWASSMLYRVTGGEHYARHAAEFIAYVLGSQELAGVPLADGTAVAGFFYRSTNRQVVQHFNHQSREHLYMEAFAAIVETQPDHPDADDWADSIEAYGRYVKWLSRYTAPYPMLASGVYREDEYADEHSFNLQHLLIDEHAREDYGRQLQEGVRLNDSLYLRRFPVWFSFRGNNAVVLSAGKAAAIAGAYMKDTELIDIAAGQLAWIVGSNPFGQSLMRGEGYRYAQQYAVLSGELTGEIPVGIQTFGNEDEPYWPQFNNATYKEVWTGNAGKWLSLVASLYAMDAIAETGAEESIDR
ncbi:glycoside hydrolase family 9 protein [Paenibacillus kobensis]|uniref:glycoside hydrolase family 9 protein n=1 Tax=Paenibacillus kobensis TaxID=59841 RepID=UPI000FD7F7C7|nr:glycoside hydrolase family 9 protein [Paenibacillus kobensis]